MGCEPRGFGWSAAVEVCSARVTRLVTDLKNLEKFSTRQPVPGTGRGGASTGAWHRARGRDLPAFRFGDRKGAWHRTRGRDLLAFQFEIAKVPGTGRGGEIC